MLDDLKRSQVSSSASLRPFVILGNRLRSVQDAAFALSFLVNEKRVTSGGNGRTGLEDFG